LEVTINKVQLVEDERVEVREQVSIEQVEKDVSSSGSCPNSEQSAA
jgi:hypothetical protein